MPWLQEDVQPKDQPHCDRHAITGCQGRVKGREGASRCIFLATHEGLKERKKEERA